MFKTIYLTINKSNWDTTYYIHNRLRNTTQQKLTPILNNIETIVPLAVKP